MRSASRGSARAPSWCASASRCARSSPRGATATSSGGAALQRILPRVNRSGASRAKVQEAVRLLEATPDHDELAARVARSPTYSSRLRGWRREEGLAEIPAELRLALEMTSHEDAERRWL